MIFLFEEWIELILRWFHVIAGIAWIGSSFYFIALDLSLKQGKNLPDKSHGEAWQVHGGGFYHLVKYLVAPSKLPSELTWFKWEAYATWVSGFALLALIYYAGAELYMIDIIKYDFEKYEAVIMSILGIIFGWLIYDIICRISLKTNVYTLIGSIFILITAMSWVYSEIFSYRGAFMQIGTILGTIMVANVLMVIIPGQKKVVASLIANETPDPKHGMIAKQRSLHNNYLTLPVIFIMISNHYPLIYATKYSWIIIPIILIIGALIRHFFNVKHTGSKPPYWVAIPVTIFTLLTIYISYSGKPELSEMKGNATLINKIPKPILANAQEIIVSKCAMCHAREPLWENMANAPKLIRLETKKDIVDNIDNIYSQSVLSFAMPPGNLSFIEDHERAEIQKLYIAINNLKDELK
ncbi:urate hydroxylase PuuD [Alphaproteobacteria bacterium]|nr:urate hydroxylase PuuD [Alphaproteobacteria bacterium]